MLFDLHNDYLTATEVERMSSDFAAMPMTVIFAVWATRLVIDAGGYFDLIKNVPHNNTLRSLTAIEDIGGIDIGDYDEFLLAAKPAYVSLTWNGKNALAGGVGSTGRLTDKGKTVLRAMERCNTSLDLSHLNEHSFWDALEYFDGRVMLSHTAVRQCFQSDRNSSDRQLRAVSESGGITGIFAAASFICGGNCSRGDYVRHMLAAIEQCGVSRVAIGTDFCGAEYYPEGFGDYGKFGALRDDLAAAGLTNNDIDKIFYINAERFFGAQEQP